MPVFFINIARLRDHLILTSTLDSEPSIAGLKAEARKFWKSISRTSQPRLTYRLLRSNLHICVSNFVFAFCACDCDFDPQLSYQMLDQAIAAFNNEYSDSLEAVEQEYSFIDFHTILDALRIRFLDLAQVQSTTGRGQEQPNIKIALINGDHPVDVEQFSENLRADSTVYEETGDCWQPCAKPAGLLVLVMLAMLLMTGFLG
jgi:hypothetical protein